MTAFDELVRMDVAGALSHHDVVYLAPAVDGINGLPVGNGDVGAQIWTPGDHIEIALNKVDLWDDGPEGPFSSWGDDAEEASTMLRSAGTLRIGHGLPTLDRLYLREFECRLRLAEAEVSLHAATGFGGVDMEALATQDPAVFVLHYRDWTEEPVPRRFEVARWGSRSLLHWYRKIRRGGDEVTLYGTECGTDGQYLWIHQRLRGLHFAMVAALEGPASARRLHSRTGCFETRPVTDFEGTLYVTVVTSEEASDPLSAAKDRLAAAIAQGHEVVRDEHRKRWQTFWQQSFVDLPRDQDYVENLWYLNSYFVASSSRGRYPINHINGIFGWTGDIRPWAHYYHWNEQSHVWPLHACGHGELAVPYYRWRRSMLDHAVEDARRLHGRDGAFYSDVSNRKGYQAADGGLVNNLTPGPQIAADFWRHFQYTRDLAFLRDSAFPVMREVAQFYLDSLTERADGFYTFTGTNAYEGNVLFSDTLTDLAHARQLFGIVISACEILGRDPELRSRCRQALDRLAGYQTMVVSTVSRIDPDSIMDRRPILFDEPQADVPTIRIWSIGRKIGGNGRGASAFPDGMLMHEGMADPRAENWIFSSTTMAPIFPANQVTLDQAGTSDFETAVNTVKALGYSSQGFCLWMVAKARLGLAEELQAALDEWPQLFQIGAQGYTHYILDDHPLRAADASCDQKIAVLDDTLDQPDEVHWPTCRSRHMSVEALPVLQLSINEMLLQSCSGTCRLFPAVGERWEGAFRLHMEGGFVVTAARAGGQVTHFLIESKSGETWRGLNPWPGRAMGVHRRVDGGWELAGIERGEMCSFGTQPDGLYCLLPDGAAPGDLVPIVVSGHPNTAPKSLGTVRLGIPKGF